MEPKLTVNPQLFQCAVVTIWFIISEFNKMTAQKIDKYIIVFYKI